MKKLTKKERHEAYKKALKHLTKKQNNHAYNWRTDCICHCLMFAAFNNYSYFDPHDLQSVFIEFSLFDPQNHASYWFNNTEEREIVLLLCIEMTK